MASVIVRKSDDKVIDASDGVINYNTLIYDNLHPPVNPIPTGADPKKYMRDVNGDIIKRPASELQGEFEDEKMAAVKVGWANVIANIPADATWKAPFVELGKLLGYE